jgi:hypothetical protein
MTEIFDMAARRTPLQIIDEGPLTARSRPAGHVPAEEPVCAASPAARASALASIAKQDLPTAPELVPSRVPRKWVLATLLSLLALVVMAGTYWYVIGVHLTEDPYVDVGDSGISTDVSVFAKDVDVPYPSLSRRSLPRSRLSPKRLSADRRAAGTISTWRLSPFT